QHSPGHKRRPLRVERRSGGQAPAVPREQRERSGGHRDADRRGHEEKPPPAPAPGGDPPQENARPPGPPPDRPPPTPRAAWRARPWRRLAVSSDSAAGAMSAAPVPCTSRAATRSPASFARPAVSDETAKTARPVISMRRRPSRSASRPPSSRKPP